MKNDNRDFDSIQCVEKSDKIFKKTAQKLLKNFCIN